MTLDLQPVLDLQPEESPATLDLQPAKPTRAEVAAEIERKSTPTGPAWPYDMLARFGDYVVKPVADLPANVLNIPRMIQGATGLDQYPEAKTGQPLTRLPDLGADARTIMDMAIRARLIDPSGVAGYDEATLRDLAQGAGTFAKNFGEGFTAPEMLPLAGSVANPLVRGITSLGMATPMVVHLPDTAAKAGEAFADPQTTTAEKTAAALDTAAAVVLPGVIAGHSTLTGKGFTWREKPAGLSGGIELKSPLDIRPDGETPAADTALAELQAGTRKAVVLADPAALPAELPEGVDVHANDAGVFLYRRNAVTPEELDLAHANGTLPEMLAASEAEAAAPAPETPLTEQQRMARENTDAMAALRDLKAKEEPQINTEETQIATSVESAKSVDKLVPVEISPEEYKAARVGLKVGERVDVATGLAKDAKRAQMFADATGQPRETSEPYPVALSWIGEVFKVNGHEMRVVDQLTDAETGAPSSVKLSGAYGDITVPADTVLHVDKGSVQAPAADPIVAFLDRAIEATKTDGTQLMEGITGAPVWMTKAALNLTFTVARHAYLKTRDLQAALAEGLRWLKAQNLTGYNEAEARDWLETNLRGVAVAPEGGRTLGAATADRRPIVNTSPATFATDKGVTTLPYQQDMLSAVTGYGWRQRVANWVESAAGKTFPRTTKLAREVGEQGARWISSRMAAKPLADAFSEDVTRGLNLDEVEFGAALHEDNLRSIRQDTLNEATQLEADAQKLQAENNPRAATALTERASKLRQQAAQVFTFIGDGGVFPTEEAYQSYLKRPAVQEAVRRHVEAWDKLVEPMYREAMKIDPAAELPARGLQTGARVNLNFVREGEQIGTGVFAAMPKGVLANVLQKKSPFGRLAKGTAAAYRPSYTEAMRNTYTRQLEIANRNKFDRLLVEHGLAVIDRPGKRDLVLGGEQTTPFEIRRHVIQADGRTMPQFENIYVRNSLVPEYRAALNLDPKAHVPLISPLAKVANGAALSGLTEMTAHLSNLSHALFWRPGVTRSFWSEIGLSLLGRADAFLALHAAIRKFSAEDQVRLRELAEIGAEREPHPHGNPWNPLTWGSRVIEKADTRTRLQLDRMFSHLAEQGLVKNTETNRREFVNQIGQYNRRAQGEVTRWLRDTGIAPFVTAGKAFNVLGLRTALLDAGAETTSRSSRVAVAATMAAKIGGALLIPAVANYLISQRQDKDGKGNVFGRPGVPLGAIDLGYNDANQRPMFLDVANILGLKRAARVTGVRGGIEAIRQHLPLGTVLDSTYRDLQNSWTAPLLGPVSRTVSVGATGYQPAIGVPRTSPVVPPGHSQAVQNLETAALEMSPVVAGIHDSLKPGATGWEWAQKQAGRFTLQPGKPTTMMANGQYARIVARAQTASYIEDVIGRARKIAPGPERMKYVRESIRQIDPRDREHAIRTLQERRILPP